MAQSAAKQGGDVAWGSHATAQFTFCELVPGYIQLALKAAMKMAHRHKDTGLGDVFNSRRAHDDASSEVAGQRAARPNHVTATQPTWWRWTVMTGEFL